MTATIHSMSDALDTIPEPRVPPTSHTLTATTPHPSPYQHFRHPCTLTLSQHTHMKQNNSTRITVTAIPYPYSVPRQPLRQTKNDHRTTDTSQGHRPSSKSE